VISAPKIQIEKNAEDVLLDAICDGQSELFYELVRPYERALYFTIYSILKNEADAEDVAQETVLKALKHIKSFRREAKFSTWLFQISLNEARMRLRKNKRRMHESIDEPENNEEGRINPKEFADRREIPSEVLQRKELKGELKRACNKLAPIYRTVFILRDMKNLSITETAEALKITQSNVKTRLLKARRKLRRMLTPGFGGGWSIGDGNWKRVSSL